MRNNSDLGIWWSLEVLRLPFPLQTNKTGSRTSSTRPWISPSLRRITLAEIHSQRPRDTLKKSANPANSTRNRRWGFRTDLPFSSSSTLVEAIKQEFYYNSICIPYWTVMLVPGRLDTGPHATQKPFLDFPCLPPPTPSSQAFCGIPWGTLSPDNKALFAAPRVVPSPASVPSFSVAAFWKLLYTCTPK